MTTTTKLPNTTTIITEKGIPFTVQVVLPGEDNRPGWDKGVTQPSNTKTLVKFYDQRYTGAGFTPLGQFVADYYLETLVKRNATHISPLALQYGVANWWIDAFAMQAAVLFAERYVAAITSQAVKA